MKFNQFKILKISFFRRLNKSKKILYNRTMDTTNQKIQRYLFSQVATTPNSDKWENAISRVAPMYKRHDDIRTEFERDYDRILHSNAYRRLKRKTQVFFATSNDHICTRIEHVQLVSSIGSTIAKSLGLNADLVAAIAIGHDIGHSPFGHHGETVIDGIIKSYDIHKKFWHEGNSLHFADNIETLIDYEGYEQNMNLTYAVRDGMICHCGEVDDNWIYPREEFLDLTTLKNASEINPYTFEGCVIKIADKISYLGRDIEDALTYDILDTQQQKELERMIQRMFKDAHLSCLNHTALAHKFTVDLCKNSSPQKGIGFSQEYFEIMNEIKSFNFWHICSHKRLYYFKRYAKLVIETIFEVLLGYYDGINTINKIQKDALYYPILTSHYKEWLEKYSNIEPRNPLYKNKILYDLNSVDDYRASCIDFISGATDNFAIKIFNEITGF